MIIEMEKLNNGHKGHFPVICKYFVLKNSGMS